MANNDSTYIPNSIFGTGLLENTQIAHCTFVDDNYAQNTEANLGTSTAPFGNIYALQFHGGISPSSFPAQEPLEFTNGNLKLNVGSGLNTSGNTLNVNSNLNLNTATIGNLTVQGTLTTVNQTTVNVVDQNITSTNLISTNISVTNLYPTNFPATIPLEFTQGSLQLNIGNGLYISGGNLNITTASYVLPTNVTFTNLIATNITNTNLHVSGTGQFNNITGANLYIDGTTNLDGDVVMGADVDIAGGLQIQGETSALGLFNASGLSTLNGGLKVNGDANITGAFQVEGASTFTGPIAAGTINAFDGNFEGDVAITGLLNVTGEGTFNNIMTEAIECTSLQTSADANIQGILTVLGETELTGNVLAEAELNVVGLTTLEGACNVAGTLSAEGVFNADGTGNFGGAVNVLGITTLTGSLDANGAANVAGTLTAEGAANVAGTLTAEGALNVTGITTLTGALDANGAANIAGVLTAEGAANVVGTLTAEGALNVTGITTMTGAANVAGLFTAEGAANVVGTLTAEGILNVGGAANVAGLLTAEGACNVAGLLTAEGAANVAGTLTAEGACNVAGLFSAEGESNFTGTVTTEGEANIGGALSVEGESNFVGLVTVEGDQNIVGGLQIEGPGGLLCLAGGITIDAGGITVTGGDIRANQVLGLYGNVYGNSSGFYNGSAGNFSTGNLNSSNTFSGNNVEFNTGTIGNCLANSLNVNTGVNAGNVTVTSLFAGNSTLANLYVTTSITAPNISTSSGNFTNMVSQNITTNTLVFTGTNSNLKVTNVNATNGTFINLSGGTLTSTTINGTNATYSGNVTINNLYVSGTQTIVNTTTANESITNSSIGTLNTIQATIGNLNNTNFTSTNILNANITSNTLTLTGTNSSLVATSLSSTFGNFTNITTVNLNVNTLTSSANIANTNLTSTNILAGNITTNTLTLTGTSSSLTATTLSSSFGNIGLIVSNDIITSTVNTTNLTANNALMTNGKITNITATNIVDTNLTSTNAVITNATITNLQTTFNSSSSNFLATNLTSTNAIITNATITNLVAPGSGPIIIPYINATDISVGNLISNYTQLGTGSSYIINLGQTGLGGTRSAYIYGDSVSTGTIGNEFFVNQNFGNMSFATSNSSAQLLIGSTGNLGVNNLNPSYSLDVSGITRIGSGNTYQINFGNSGVGSVRAAYLNGDGTNGSYVNQQPGSFSLATNNANAQIFIASSGNVGINNLTPTVSLDVVGSAKISTSLSTGAVYSTNITSTNIVSTNSTFTNSIFTTSTISNIVSTNITSSNAIINNLGIGISPSYPLDVSGTVRFGSGGGFLINLGNTGAGGGNRSGYIYGDTSGTGTVGNISIVNQQSGYLSLATANASAQILIGSTGNIGINNLSPTVSLDVTGSAKISTSLSTGAVYSTNITSTNAVNTNITSTNIILTSSTVTNQNSTNITSTNAYISNLGVGIAPSFPLDVSGTIRVGSGSGFLIDLGNAGVGTTRSGYIYGDSVGTGTVGNIAIVNQQAGYLSLATANASAQILIGSTGNVGINNLSPTVSLDVTGSAKISTSLSTGAVYSTNMTSTNAVYTNMTSTNILLTNSTVTNQISTNQISTNITSSNAYISNLGVAISPSYPLDVSGTTRIGNGSGFLINLGNAGVGGGNRSGYINGDSAGTGTVGNIAIVNQQLGSITLSTNNGTPSNQFILNSSGNVGIQIATPLFPLDVNGSIRATSLTSGSAFHTNTVITNMSGAYLSLTQDINALNVNVGLNGTYGNNLTVLGKISCPNISSGSFSATNITCTNILLCNTPTTPIAPLHIQQAITSSVSSGNYFNYNTGISAYSTQNVNISAFFANPICVGNNGAVYCASDSRFKNIVDKDINLEIIDKLEPIIYKNKDPRNPGEKLGFIAQKVKQELPDSINLIKSFISNICAMAKIKNQNLLLPNHSQYDIKIDDLIKCYILENDVEKEIILKVLDVVDQHNILVNYSFEEQNIYILGTEINDYHHMDYRDTFVLAFAGVKELRQRVLELENFIKKKNHK